MSTRFRNRSDAGRILAESLRRYAARSDVLVLALPRGGVPVGFEIARALGVPLDVFVVRKLGVPNREELAMGAIATGNVRVINDDVIEALRIPEHVVNKVTSREMEELRRRESAYRGSRPPPEVAGKIVILVDDGLATGATMRAAVAALEVQNPARIVVAVPTAAPSAREEFGSLVDEIVCAMTPDPFQAVGLWYDDFSQTTDEEVRDLLEQAERLQRGKHESTEPTNPMPPS